MPVAPIAEVEVDPIIRAALERYLEIVSEASRYIPPEMQQTYGSDVPWRAVADLGNILRHAYHMTDLPALWRIYQQDLDPLEAVVKAMLADLDPDAPTLPAPPKS
ncbi:HepT-like ribonuclease domain-containing protein [Devosia ginsengisoli]|uniref:HepT-like ribonuclease domain-containing protein n=1 Tax=Devosia ginsengisoli TaxID=400770 RepID=UPI0016475743|nr:HepT-like ribonuclease domain-containing protein [Devosia ginsengisoli]